MMWLFLIAELPVCLQSQLIADCLDDGPRAPHLNLLYIITRSTGISTHFARM